MNSTFEQIKQITSQINNLLDIVNSVPTQTYPFGTGAFTEKSTPSMKSVKIEPIVRMIYVLELENKNFFVYVSENLPDYKILKNCEIYYDFTKKFKPLKIIEKIQLNDEFQIDAIVKSYMNMYGYAYVRGGSYTTDPLTPAQEAIIQQELDYIDTGEFYEYSFSQILGFENHYYDSIEDIDSLISKTNTTYENYKKDKSKYDNLFPVEYKSRVNDIVIEDIDWLYDICVLLSENIPNKKKGSRIDPTKIDLSINYIQKYNNLINGFRHLYYLFETTSFFDHIPIGENSIYLKYPRFLFDLFFYHSSTYEITNKSLNTLTGFCLLLKIMILTAQNRIDEYRHDVNTYDNSIEWIYPRIIYILEKKRLEFNDMPRKLEVD